MTQEMMSDRDKSVMNTIIKTKLARQKNLLESPKSSKVRSGFVADYIPEGFCILEV